MEKNQPRNFSWVEKGLLAACGMPLRAEHYQYLHDVGIQHVICLMEEKASDIPAELDLKFHKIAIVDFNPPTLDQINDFLNYVDFVKNEKESVVVHCMHGKGRTGAMLGCYLIKERKLDEKEALSEIRKLRPGSVETIEQENVIEKYYLKVSEK